VRSAAAQLPWKQDSGLKDAQLVRGDGEHLHGEPPADGGPEADMQASQQEVAAPTVRREGHRQDGVVGAAGLATIHHEEAATSEDGRLPVSAVAMEQALAVPPQSPEIESGNRGHG